MSPFHLRPLGYVALAVLAWFAAIFLRLCHVLAWSWVWVLAPLWMAYLLAVLVCVGAWALSHVFRCCLAVLDHVGHRRAPLRGLTRLDELSTQRGREVTRP